jgi:hypothetical protein
MGAKANAKANGKANGKMNGKAIKSEPNGDIVIRSVTSTPKKSSLAKRTASWVSWYVHIWP